VWRKIISTFYCAKNQVSGKMINAISSSVSKLTMTRLTHDGNSVGSAIGTGFLWEETSGLYLITNWHNVTGVNPDTNKMLSQFFPNLIFATVFCEADNRPGMIGAKTIRVPLYDAEVPLWLEHPEGRAVDCIAIPIALPESLKVKSVPMNRHNFERLLKPAVGMDCFIIGYPEGLMGAGHTPIWKRASIASEPNLDHDKRPLLLVDTASRPGMSGSPVLMRHHGLFAPTDDLMNASIGMSENFLGIYSGRLGDDGLGLQLGRIWKGHVIDEIIASQCKGVHPNQAL
jgi:hypothetical protein